MNKDALNKWFHLHQVIRSPASNNIKVLTVQEVCLPICDAACGIDPI